jgi:sugar lactone lactonase YvrE
VKYDILGDGSAGKRQIVAEMPEVTPDGMAFAADGSILIACFKPDLILRWTTTPGFEVIMSDPHHCVLASPTNCAFCGPDLESVAIPNIGANFVTRFEVPELRGQRLFYPAV